MTGHALVNALRQVPTWHPRILELARRLAGPKGVDPEKAVEAADEIAAASTEIERVKEWSGRLKEALNNLAQRDWRP